MVGGTIMYKLQRKIKKAKGRLCFEIFNYSVLTMLGLITLIPFLYVLMVSLMPTDQYLKYGITIPNMLSFDNYLILFLGGSRILQSYGVTIFITVVGTFISLFLTSTLAYGISKKALPGGKAITGFLFFTLLFNGGIIPTYFVVKYTGLLDSLWSVMLPVAINTFNLFVMRNFFAQIPDSMEESAKIDGANEFTIFAKIIIPLSLPVMVSIGLFYAVDRWNEFFNAMLYINNLQKWPLQLVLRDIISFSGVPVDPSSLRDRYAVMPPSEVLKMSAIISSMLPILFAYPFVQKYFVKGIMVGAIKG